MTGLPDGMQAHLDGEVTTLAFCWRLIAGEDGGGARLHRP